MVTVILDGYNVIHALPTLERQLDRGLEAAREALVSLCRSYQSRRGDIERLYVVFDGQRDAGLRSQGGGGGVAVLFTHRPETADERILSLIRQGGGGRFVVVSNDVEVTNNARGLGAGVTSVHTFYEQLRPASARRAQPDGVADKTVLPARDAQRITDECWSIWKNTGKPTKAERA